MKTNRKIEIGILITCCLLGIIFLSYVRANMYYSDEELTELTGNFETETIEIENFNRLKILTDIPVIYKLGDPKIELYTDENLLDQFNFEIKDQQLTVSNKMGAERIDNMIQNNSRITIFNNENLSYLRTEMNANLDIVDSIKTSEMIIECDGNASVRLHLITEYLDVAIHGNSNVNIQGKSDKTDLFSDGNARFYLEDFPSKKLKLRSSGNSGGKAYVSENIDARTSGNSQVTLIGSPTQSNINSRSNSHINTNFNN